MSLKSKLLAAVGDLFPDDFSESALVDILVDRIARQDKEIENLRGANAHERLVMQAERDRMHRDRDEMRRNPLYLAHGVFYFLGPKKELYTIEVCGNQLRPSINIHGIFYPMQEITEFFFKKLMEKSK